MGQRLDVVDQRGPPVDAALEGPRRRAGGRGRAAVEPVHQRGLLPGDVAGRDRGEPHLHRRLGPPALGEGAGDGAERRGGRVVDADDHLLGADRGRSQQRPVQDQVRGGREQQLVLAAGRLALGAVDHDHGGAPALADRS
jgi:hypothetical protein